MAHWVNTYPHTIYASVLLLDNKIYNWKVGQRYWKSPLDMTWRLPFPENMDEFTVQHTSWEVNNDDEHNRIFKIDAKEWMKQWKVAEGYNGSMPYLNRI